MMDGGRVVGYKVTNPPIPIKLLMPYVSLLILLLSERNIMWAETKAYSFMPWATATTLCYCQGLLGSPEG